MLLDLNKEYLKDMGVNVLGDIIAILKHAKLYHEKVMFVYLTLDFYCCCQGSSLSLLVHPYHNWFCASVSLGC